MDQRQFDSFIDGSDYVLVAIVDGHPHTVEDGDWSGNSFTGSRYFKFDAKPIRVIKGASKALDGPFTFVNVQEVWGPTGDSWSVPYYQGGTVSLLSLAKSDNKLAPFQLLDEERCH